MKILMVSVFSNHFFNWVLQLKNSGHEIYWFDVHDANTYVTRIDFVHQIVRWKRKFEYPGRQWVKKNFASVDSVLEQFNQRKLNEVFHQKLIQIKPDVVHSFEIHSACIPFIKIMEKHPQIKWIYTAWGTDLYFYHHDTKKLRGIKNALSSLDYMFADCIRDFLIAKNHGFTGEFLGAWPGGGGYDVHSLESKIRTFKDKRVILIKGYQDKFGRCNIVLQALLDIKEEIKDFEIIVFAANEEVKSFVESVELSELENLTILGRLKREEVLDLMGSALIYIGNSISDGVPNTLWEAIVMEALPIQSNPGGATAEIIEHGKNGFLIENPEDYKEISRILKSAFQDLNLVRAGIAFNTNNIKPNLDREYVRQQILKKYLTVEQNL